ncbi:cadherin-like beta sandwich domain-containing protein [Paenibacillus agri]|uniref:Cadherin-like beta sandwich domain-containing protein n=1 Tax=Paenibacillus agri TaxID=2744309 RepID=A0A850EJV3_9BACL|nr:cadherin-like beta sandwich domain-containing protein [Paenibacillus agri]NUU60656.1 cadherin-like beta sandwich domain-containing protein [Paenibacillus agri]
MKIRNQRWLAVVLVAAMVVQSLWSFAGTGQAATGPINTNNLAKNIVISQFYGGKKDDVLDLYTNDFVELYNPTAEPISLNGWSIQYADNKKNSWKAAILGSPTANIPGYGYYLVALGSNGNVGSQLPQPDAAESSFKIGNNSGKLALLNTTQSLTSNDPMKDTLKDNVIDFVGYDPEVDASLGSPAAQTGKQSTIQRLVFDPLDPEKSTNSAATPNRGNNWDTRNNSKDFEKIKDSKPRNSSSTAAYAILENNQSVQMKSGSTVDPAHNKITLTAFNGIVKQGQWASEDFTVTGLPAGLFATASASGEGIEITITGDGTANIVSDANLTFEINPGAWDQSNKPTNPVSVYQKNNTATLVKFTPSNKIAAVPASSSIKMSGAKDLNARFQLNLTAGIPANGTLSSDAYSVSGLPSGDWKIAAEGQSSDNTITFSISGTATTPVMDTAQLKVIVKSEAMQDNDWLASEPISISLLRYSSPVLSDEARKQKVEHSIVDDNTSFNDAITKEYKYGSSAMGANEYTFLRGTHSLFKSDLASGLIPSPASIIAGWKDKDILTYTQGDAHIQNVGTFNDSKDLMVFSLNDVDSAGIGSFYDDLIRFVTSTYVVKYDKDSSGLANLQDADFRDVSKTFLDTYKDTLIEINNDNSKKATKLTRSNVTAYTQSVMDKVSKVSYAEALQKLLGKRALNGKLNIDGNPDKFELATEAEVASLKGDWENYKTQVRANFPNLSDDQFNAYFTIKDIVRRIHQGIGSIGVERYNVLIEGPSNANTDDILLDVKEQTRDAYISKDAYIKTAVDTDAYLGVLEASNRSFLIREVSPFKGDYTDKPFKNKDELEQYLIDAAKAYAYADSRLDKVSDELDYKFEERFVTNILPVWNDLENFILNAAEDYSHQVVADFALVQGDMLAGKLIDVSTLDKLTVDTGTLSPSFDAGITEYSVTVPHSVESLNITAKASDAKASLTAQGEPYTNETAHTLKLSVGKNDIPFTVTARNGSTKTYTVTVIREAAEEDSSSADLSDLKLSSGTLNPVFEGALTHYTSQVDNDVSGITVTASVYDSAATFTVNGTPGTSGQASDLINLNAGSNELTIVVTAKDGSSKTYTVDVIRKAAEEAKSNADLSSLTLSSGTLNPLFAPDVTSYATQVDYKVSGISVTANVYDSAASFTVNGTPAVSGQASGGIDLQVGSNIIPIEVTAQSGFKKTYRVTVTRAAESIPDPTGPTTPDPGTPGPGTPDPGTPGTPTPSTPSGGTNSGNIPVHSGSIPVNGGVLTLNGATISVPAGSIESGIEITVSKVTQSSNLSTDDTLKLLGDVYEITKNKAGDFGQPVTITLTFDPSKVNFNNSVVGLYWLNEQSKKWVKLDNLKVDQANGTVSGTVTHFTKFAVLVSDKTEPSIPKVEKDFADIHGHWAEVSIKELVSLGGLTGYPDDTFRPDNKITRAEFVTMIAKTLNLQATNGKEFADTKTHWAHDTIATAAALGIVDGYNGDTFGPDEWVTREQVAAMVVRAAKLALADKDISFSDSSKISAWALPALKTAIDQGLINGYTDGTVKPTGNTSRAEAATILLRALQLKK